MKNEFILLLLFSALFVNQIKSLCSSSLGKNGNKITRQKNNWVDNMFVHLEILKLIKLIIKAAHQALRFLR